MSVTDTILDTPLSWVSKDIPPLRPGVVLLYNKCDGYHVAFTRQDEEGLVERHFTTFLGEEYALDFYEAWAYLPDPVEQLYRAFVDPVLPCERG